MPSHLLLWPIAILLGAALLIPRLSPFIGQAGRTLAFLLASVLSFGATLLIVLQGTAGGAPWRFSTWAGLGGSEGLALQADPLGLSALLLVGLVGMAILVGSLDDHPEVASEEYVGGVLTILAGLMAMALAQNLLTLLVAGLLMDAGIILGVGMTGRSRWLFVTVLQSLLSSVLLLGATLLTWGESAQSSFALLSGQAATLAVLAMAVRLAPLPFTFYPIAFESLPQRVRALLPALTLLPGGLLAGRLAALALEPPLALLAWLAPLAAVGVALSGWVAWRSHTATLRLAMLATGQGAWALWAFCWGAPDLAVAVAWGAVPALAALALVSERMSERRAAQIPALIATLMLVGLPGSALWRALTALSGEAWGVGQPWLLTLGIVGLMGSAVAIIELLMLGEEGVVPPSRLVGLSLLALLSVPLLGLLWGVKPPALGQRLADDAPLVTQLALPVVGLAGGWWLWRARPFMMGLAPVLDNVGALFSFAWLWRLVGRAGWLLLRAFQAVIRVLEGENYGWFLFFLFVAVIYFLQG